MSAFAVISAPRSYADGGSAFSGTFEDSAGNPLAGVQFSIQGQGYSANFTTGSDGSFSVNVPSGPNYSIWTYGLYASNVTGGGSQDEGEYRYAAELDLTNSIIGDTIQLPPTTPVTFAVTDSNGDPVAGAEVSISDGVDESIADPDTDGALTNADINSVEYGTTFDYGTTGSDGTVTFDVWASPTTNSGFAVQVTPPDGSNLAGSGSQYSGLLNGPTTIPITLATVTGALFDSSGQALSGQSVSLETANGGEVASAQTSQDGNFSMTAPPGSYSLVMTGQFGDPTQYSITIQNVDLSKPLELGKLELPTNQLTVKVSDPRGHPVVGASVVAACSTDSFPLLGLQATGSQCTSENTSGTGSADIQFLPSATMTITVTPPAGSGLATTSASFAPQSGITEAIEMTNPVSQRITFAAVAKKTLAQSPLTVAGTSSSGLAVTFTTTTPTVCTSGGTDGATINLVGTGTCIVDASQAGNATYGAAAVVTRGFAVAQASQKITFAALAKKTLAQLPVTVSATASSGLVVTFTSTTPTVCTSGGTNGASITLVGTGTCTVDASQAGNATYSAAAVVSRGFVVSQASQTITFAALVNQTPAQSPLTVSATASSGLAVTFTTSTTAVCTAGGANGATITLVKAGTCTVQASQAGNTVYKTARVVKQSFRVS
jgi:hypothetical protein